MPSELQSECHDLRDVLESIKVSRTGRLLIRSSLLEKLDTLSSKHKSDKRLQREVTARIQLTQDSYLSEIFSAPPSLLLSWAETLGIPVPGFKTNVDLVKGRYEGGFKVWESSADLVGFLSEDQQFVGKLLDQNRKIRVLEIGCGAGLGSLAFLSRLLGHHNFDSGYRIHLQDYNWEVLATLTLLNFSLNLPFDFLRSLIDNKFIRFYSGDWGKFRKNPHGLLYDIIFMSETIYDEQNFSSLHELLDRTLGSDGIVVIATKDTYFGLSGGLYPWLAYLETRDIFRPITIAKSSKSSIPRSLLVLHRNSA